MDPRRLLPVLTAVACACVVATLVVRIGGPDRARGGDGTPRPAASGSGAVAEILAGWDRRRSSAWAAGDAGVLRALYTDDSRAGAADVRHLRAWTRRGLTVQGLETQVLALEVAERTPHRLVLAVTDRVVGGQAVGGAAPVALPVDRASTRTVELVRVGEEWLVSEVRRADPGQDRAAERTSRTSSSSKS
ncbi:hypothetical protein SAMN04489844_3353 [Nocardioides exalbidus]|uniref:SnoaL-like domain-containing protein n=1 Tax=Nocardioides exalbidus TaxID=402596 RepID=A0A1H4WUZ9_9ACTN|nr:hypothetical protein [Nocardioides exalbidus]SEC96431.1 hypothetical protein SAMN04489844_3353 [Nocardioides exalbidus]